MAAEFNAAMPNSVLQWQLLNAMASELSSREGGFVGCLHHRNSDRSVFMKIVTLFSMIWCLIYSGCAVDAISDAACKDDTATVRRLINSRTNLEQRDLNDMTALMNAAEAGSFNSCEYLISRGANVNAHNDTGSVLFWAVDSGNPRLVETLIQKGVDVHWRNCEHYTALDFARTQGKMTLAVMIERAGHNDPN
jgi:hypothetical protein